MKRFSLLLLVALLLLSGGELFAQLPDSPAYLQEGQVVSNFKLYPTQNMWNFLKLDTRTGEIWQVQYGVEGDEYRHETELNNKDLTYGQNTKPGRFRLHPTSNRHNFILLDCEDGRIWQVQWDFGRLHRSIWRIESSPLPDCEIGDVFIQDSVEVEIVENLGDGYYRITPTADIKRMSWIEANDYCEALGNGWRLPTYEECLVLAKGKGTRFWTCEVDSTQDTVFFYDPNNVFNVYKNYTTDKSLKLKILPIKDVYLH